MTDPVRFCRYRSLAGNSADWVRDSIIHSKHYFASPLAFNDPFDCRPNFEIQGNRADLVKYFEGVIGRHMPELSREARRAEARRRVSDPDCDPRLPKNMAGFRRMYHETVTSHVGVMCLSEVHDDILMWAHYADSHRGVCLIFDPEEEFFATAQRVNYKKTRPRVNPVVNSYDEMLEAAMFTKSDHWAYEREWRILQYKKGSGVYTVPTASLRQVILGAEISEENQTKVRQWSVNGPNEISIASAALSQSEFRVEVPSVWRRDA